jgi:hypothetical protein
MSPFSSQSSCSHWSDKASASRNPASRKGPNQKWATVRKEIGHAAAITGHGRQALPPELIVPTCLWFAMSSGCAETKSRKVTVEGPEEKHEVKLESSEEK